MEPRINISRSAGSTLREITNARNHKIVCRCAEAVDTRKSLWKRLENWYGRAHGLAGYLSVYGLERRGRAMLY